MLLRYIKESEDTDNRKVLRHKVLQVETVEEVKSVIMYKGAIMIGFEDDLVAPLLLDSEEILHVQILKD